MSNHLSIEKFEKLTLNMLTKTYSEFLKNEDSLKISLSDIEYDDLILSYNGLRSYCQSNPQWLRISLLEYLRGLEHINDLNFKRVGLFLFSKFNTIQ